MVIGFAIISMAQHVTGANCEVPADSEVLGLGVRLGFYFQFASNLLPVFNRPSEAVGSILVSSMFMTGYFIAALYSITHSELPPGAIIPTTWFVLLDISIATTIFVIINPLVKAKLSF
jgi:hypothetical protein